jgi:lysophospholipase L1-like esterase
MSAYSGNFSAVQFDKAELPAVAFPGRSVYPSAASGILYDKFSGTAKLMRKETLLVVISTITALVIAEVFLSLFFPQRTVRQYLTDRPAMFVADETLFMTLEPGFNGYLKEAEFRVGVSINSLGYRQPEFDPLKGSQLRILVVGDSFTFGYGVEESEGYVRVLEQELNALAPAKDIEVINTGVPAWWTDAYYLYLKTRGLDLEPDVVLLGLFMGNDIDARDARYAIWPELDAEGLPLATTSERVRIDNGHRVRTEWRVRWKIPVLRNSHVFQLLYSSGKNIGRALNPKIQAATLYTPSYSAETQAVIERVKMLIEAMARLCDERGVRFVVAMIPEKNQVYPDPDALSQGLDFTKPQRLFSQYFADKGIAYFDLLPAVREAAATVPDGELYYSKDSHFTRTGYRVAGEEIARYLLHSDVLDAP